MKILIADPDRDFLVSFQRLLELSEIEVTTAFDGTQVINKTAQQFFDLVVLSYNIPRISYRELLKMLNENNIPVILLLRNRINADILLDDVLANAHIRFPFFPDEFIGLIHEVADKCSKDEKIVFADTEIDTKKFLLCGKTRVTNEEINTVKALLNSSDIKAKRAEPYINSLNNKFSKLGVRTRIRYKMKEGYRMVIDNE